MQSSKKFARAMVVLAFAIIMAVTGTASYALEGWGVHFENPGQPPVGNATSEYLEKYNAHYLGDVNQKKIFLTFDAGYEAGYTPKILDTLKKHDVKAAFFLVGNYLKTEPDLVRRMCDEGHIVGNHTFRHPDMSRISELSAFKKEIEELETLYKETTGHEIARFYRPPEGKYSEKNLGHANELGYKTVFWSLAYRDWMRDSQPSRKQAFEKLLPRIHPGAIVLLHSTSKTNADILDELLTIWKSEGYEFGTLEEL